MKIYLIRHAQSLGNLDKSHYATTPTHLTPLSEEGEDQAFETGEKLRDFHLKDAEKYYDNTIKCGLINHNIFCSPYKIAKDTLNLIYEGYYSKIDSGDYKSNFEEKISERPELSEQQFGLFDGLDDYLREKLFPKEYATYKHNGPFYGRIPQGESQYDVYNRLQLITQELINSTNDCIVVSHATTLKILRMSLLKKLKYLDESYLKNGSISLIEKEYAGPLNSNIPFKMLDRGLIFNGFS